MDLFKRQTTRWSLDGKRVAPGTPGAIKTIIESKKWYCSVKGTPKPLSADKSIATRMAKKLAGDAELRSAGLLDPFEVHRDRPIDFVPDESKKGQKPGHLQDYESILLGKGSVEGHVDHVVQRIRAIIRGCGFCVIGDIDHGKVSTWLTEQRKPRAMIAIPKGHEFTPSQAAAILDLSPTGLNMMVKRHNLPAKGNGKARRLPRATIEAIVERRAQGKSPETINHYIRAIRGFTRWLARSDRLRKNPLEGIALINAGFDIRHARRELTADEIRLFLEGTQSSTRTFRGLSGIDRACLYLTAAATGFRARALAHLTAADFSLSSESPVVTMAARFNKSKKTKLQPLPPEAATVLASYLHHKPLSKPVWGTSWLGRGAEMIRRDLEAVGIPYVVEGSQGPEYADFHALRHSYLTLLGRSGVDLRIAQLLAGHSTPVLTARYTHRRQDELAGAVAKLPMLTNQEPRDFAMQPKPKAAESGCTVAALTGGNLRPFQASPGTEPTLENLEGYLLETLENMGKTLDFEAKESSGPSRIRTCNQGIMSLLSEGEKQRISSRKRAFLFPYFTLVNTDFYHSLQNAEK